MDKKWVHIAALVAGVYLVFVYTSSDGNTPASDLANLLQPSSGVSASDISIAGWAGLGLVGWSAYQLVA
jgi:hypothetical protein